MMKQIKIYITLLTLLGSFSAMAQVGVGQVKPEGMLDLRNSNYGLVFPKVALSATNVAAPVTNPNGGGLVAGTAVHNTNTTQTGNNDVFPGIYAWDGSMWIPQYLKEDSEIFEQSSLNQRVTRSGGYVDITGLGNGSTFTAKYSGTYRIKANFNFGAGEIETPPSGNDINIATQEGQFRFTFNGTSHIVYTHAYSAYNNDVGSGTLYDNFRHDTSLVLYETLVSGQTYNFRLELDILVSNEFINGGNSGDGRAIVGVDLPCTVEFTFVQD